MKCHTLYKKDYYLNKYPKKQKIRSCDHILYVYDYNRYEG